MISAEAFLEKISAISSLARRLFRRRASRHLTATLNPSARLEALHLRPRQVSVDDSAALGLGERLEIEKSRGSEVVGIRISDSSGTSLGGDVNAHGTSVSYDFRGPSRQNEEGIERVCEVLINRLNADGSAWGRPSSVPPPLEPERGVDCIAVDGATRLLVQVTRAERKPTLWARLAAAGHVKGKNSVEEAADALRSSISHKAKRTTQAQRAELLLALDATETAGLALDSVVATFRCRHGPWAVGLGYRAIWLVGPTCRLTSRLDNAVRLRNRPVA